MRIGDTLVKGMASNLTREEQEYVKKIFLRLDNIETSDTLVSSVSQLRTVNVYTADNYFDKLYFNQLLTPSAVGLNEDVVLQYNATTEEWEPVTEFDNLTGIGLGTNAPATGLKIATGNIDLDTGDLTIPLGDLAMTSGAATLTNGNLTLTNGAFYVTNGNASIGGTLGVTGNVGIGQAPTSNPLDVYASGALAAVFTSNTDNAYVHIESGMDGGAEEGGVILRDSAGDSWGLLKDVDDDFSIYDYNTGIAIINIPTGGNINLTPGGLVNITKAGEQIRFSYDGSNYMSLAIDASGDALFSATGTKIQFQDALQSDDFVSETTGWRITDPGYGDFRDLFANTLRVQAFTAETTSSLAGSIIVTKSNAVVNAEFTIPNTSATATLTVRDHEGFLDTAVFASGDTVLLRVIDISTGLIVTDVYGTVTNHANPTPGDGQQTWDFTTTTAGYSSADVIHVGAVVLDYGVSGDGIWEATAIDSGNSPYSQISTWGTDPTDKTVHTRLGNLYGVTTVDEFGLWAGDGTGDANTYFHISDQGAQFNNIAMRFRSGAGVNNVILDPSGPYISVGGPAPTSYGSAGIFIGLDGADYKMFVGDATNSFSWDGSDIAITGAGGYVNLDSAGLYFNNGGSGYTSRISWYDSWLAAQMYTTTVTDDIIATWTASSNVGGRSARIQLYTSTESVNITGDLYVNKGTGQLRLENSGSNWDFYAGIAGNLSFSNWSAITLSSNTNITGTLTVTGTAKVYDPGATTRYFELYNSLSNYQIGISGSSNSLYILDSNSGYSPFRIYDNAITGSVVINVSEFVINENSGDYDFRVESNGNANMLFVDGGNDAVVIGNNVPLTNYELTVYSTGDTGIGIQSTRNATGNGIGGVRFVAYNDNATPEEILYGGVIGLIDNATDGSEGGRVAAYVYDPNAADVRYRMTLYPDEAVFNEDSDDVDFRVESNGDANMLFVDGGNDVVGIGTNSPSGNYELHVDGTTHTTMLNIGAAGAEIAISGGVLTLDRTSTVVDVGAETGTTDNLDTINGGIAGDVIILRAHAGDTITVTESGNIRGTGTSVAISYYELLTLWYSGATWYWVSFATA